MGNDAIVLKPVYDPGNAHILRNVLVFSGLTIAAAALVLPVMASVDPLVSYIMLPVALMEILMAFFLPGIMEQVSGKLSVELLPDRIRLLQPGFEPVEIPAGNIRDVREETGARQMPGTTDIVLILEDAARILPYKSVFSQSADTVRIGNLSIGDIPLDRIRKLLQSREFPAGAFSPTAPRS